MSESRDIDRTVLPIPDRPYEGELPFDAKDPAATFTPITGLVTQLCGDAHLSNFGGFAAPDRSAPARSGDPIAISSYLGKSDAFDRALAAFADAYADQNDRDYTALQEAAASGRITVKEGV